MSRLTYKRPTSALPPIEYRRVLWENAHWRKRAFNFWIACKKQRRNWLWNKLLWPF